MPQLCGKAVDQFVDIVVLQRVDIPYRINETVNAEELVVHQGDVFQKHVVRYHLVIVLVGIVVDQQFDILVQVFEFNLEHFQKHSGFPVHGAPLLKGNVDGYKTFLRFLRILRLFTLVLLSGKFFRAVSGAFVAGD